MSELIEKYMKINNILKPQKEDTVSESVIYNMDEANPLDDTEVLVLGGAGRYTLKGLRNKARREAGMLHNDLDTEDEDSFRRSARNVKQLTNTLNTIVAAYDELHALMYTTRNKRRTKYKNVK